MVIFKSSLPPVLVAPCQWNRKVFLHLINPSTNFNYSKWRRWFEKPPSLPFIYIKTTKIDSTLLNKMQHLVIVKFPNQRRPKISPFLSHQFPPFPVLESCLMPQHLPHPFDSVFKVKHYCIIIFYLHVLARVLVLKFLQHGLTRWV